MNTAATNVSVHFDVCTRATHSYYMTRGALQVEVEGDVGSLLLACVSTDRFDAAAFALLLLCISLLPSVLQPLRVENRLDFTLYLPFRANKRNL